MKLPFFKFIKAHHISRAALCAGVLVAAVVFFVVGIGLRLMEGPVSLGPLKGTLAGAIHDALPGIVLDYDQAAVEWSRDQGRVNLVVLGTRLYDRHGKVVASAPKATIDLAAAPFLQGRFKVRRITLVGMEFQLVHMKNGRLRLGSETDAADDDIIGRISDVIDKNGGGQQKALDSFAVRDARIGIYDEVTGLVVSTPRASVVIRSRGQAIAASFDADVLLSGSKSHVIADVTVPPNNGVVTGSVAVRGMDLRALGASAKMFDGVRKLPMVVNAAVNFSVQGVALTKADFDVDAAGEIPVAAMKQKALHVKSLRLVGHYDGLAHHLALSTIALQAREAQAALHGIGAFELDSTGDIAKVHAEFAGRNVVLNLPGIFAQPVGYQSVSLSGDYLAGPRQFTVSKFTVTGAQGFALDASGTLTLNDAGAPGVEAKARIGALPIRTLLHYWPLMVAPGARTWIAESVFAGQIGPLEAETHFTPGMLDQDILPEDSLKLTFALKDVEGSYINGLTHATGVQGDAVITGDTFKASFSSGRIGALTVSRGEAVIPNLHLVGTTGQFSVHIDGSMPDVMTLIDLKPLSYPTRFGIDPKTTGGKASIDLSFQVPMLANLPVDKVGIGVKADVQDFSVNLGHLRIANGDVHFDVDNDRLHQTGQVNLADARLVVDWTEAFHGTDPDTTHLTVKGPLTESARAALNIGLHGLLHGTVPVTADIVGHRGSLTRADVTADFTPVSLTVPIVNLEKVVGQAATGRIQVNFAPGDMVQDETIRVTGPVLTAQGTANFDKTGALSVLNLTSVKMGPLNDLAFQLTRTANGNDYVLRGHSLDGSKIGRNGSNEAPSGPQPMAADDAPDGHFHIDAKLDHFALRNGVSISPLNMDMAGTGNRISALAMSGALSAGTRSAPIAANLENVSSGRRVTLTANDMGILLRGLFSFDSLRGGALAATINLPGRADDAANPAAPAPDFTGTLTVKDFTVINQPMLARMFSAGSLTGLGDLMGGDGMTMEELNVPFTSKNNVISINGARVVGRAIGASADGYLDRPRDTIALKGSLIPAYGVNSMISNIPLLGDLLASKKGEGIFGIIYTANGSAEKPEISVNPLSILTPGIFRRIFEGHIPNATNAPSNQPPPGTVTPATPTPRPN